MSEPTNQQQWRPSARWYGREVSTRILSGALFSLIILQFGAQFTGHTTPLHWLLHGDRMLVYLAVVAGLALLAFLGGGIGAVRERIVLRRLARQPGWSYDRRADGLDERWTHPPFHGRDTRVGPLAQGPVDGAWCRIFGYHYTTGSGDNSTRHRTRVITVELPGRLPIFSIGPESLRGAIVPGLAKLDVDTENETFNRRYRVLAGDPPFAHAVLTPRVIEALLRIEPLSWHIDGSDIVAAGSPGSAKAMEHRLQILHEIGANIPRFLYRS